VLIQESIGGLYVRADNYVFRINPGEAQRMEFYADQFGSPLAKAARNIRRLMPGSRHAGALRQRSAKGMPPICMFSDLNHPPSWDFIKHLPYSSGDSGRLSGRVQGYSFWTNPDPSKPPIQVGVSPDRTAEGAILSGYAFESEWKPDSADRSAAPYRRTPGISGEGYVGGQTTYLIRFSFCVSRFSLGVFQMWGRLYPAR
jgi:hypothetical protein